MICESCERRVHRVWIIQKLIPPQSGTCDSLALMETELNVWKIDFRLKIEILVSDKSAFFPDENKKQINNFNKKKKRVRNGSIDFLWSRNFQLNKTRSVMPAHAIGFDFIVKNISELHHRIDGFTHGARTTNGMWNSAEDCEELETIDKSRV